jgi:hypothetical protein
LPDHLDGNTGAILIAAFKGDRFSRVHYLYFLFLLASVSPATMGAARGATYSIGLGGDGDWGVFWALALPLKWARGFGGGCRAFEDGARLRA